MSWKDNNGLLKIIDLCDIVCGGLGPIFLFISFYLFILQRSGRVPSRLPRASVAILESRIWFRGTLWKKNGYKDFLNLQKNNPPPKKKNKRKRKRKPKQTKNKSKTLAQTIQI